MLVGPGSSFRRGPWAGAVLSGLPTSRGQRVSTACRCARLEEPWGSSSRLQPPPPAAGYTTTAAAAHRICAWLAAGPWYL